VVVYLSCDDIYAGSHIETLINWYKTNFTAKLQHLQIFGHKYTVEKLISSFKSRYLDIYISANSWTLLVIINLERQVNTGTNGQLLRSVNQRD